MKPRPSTRTLRRISRLATLSLVASMSIAALATIAAVMGFIVYIDRASFRDAAELAARVSMVGAMIAPPATLLAASSFNFWALFRRSRPEVSR